MSGPDAGTSDHQQWLARAESCLALARIGRTSPAILFEDLVFYAQQAVEKALKAVLVSRAAHFPRTHDIGALITRVRNAGCSVPDELLPAAQLTPYAVRTRYPGGPPVTEEDYEAAVQLAEQVVAWVRRELGQLGPA